MRLYKILPLLILLVGMLAFAQDDTPDTIPVIIVTQPIPRGTIFVPDLLYGANAVVEVRQWAAEYAPQTAYHDLAEVEGMVARLDLTTRMPLLQGNLVADLTQTAAIGSDAALLIPEGMLGVPLRTEASAVKPLDCVDVYGVFNFGGELANTNLLLASGGVVVDSDTVAVKAEDASVIVWAQDGQIPVIVASADGC